MDDVRPLWLTQQMLDYLEYEKKIESRRKWNETLQETLDRIEKEDM